MKRIDPLSLPDALQGMVERFERMRTDGHMPPQRQENLDRLMDMLIVMYMTTNIGQQKIPLKLFMNDLEKRMIESCLSLTLGNQRSAASILGVKPTALFEKIKKHGIREACHKPSFREEPSLAPRAGLTGAEWLT
jgi:DNA-binding NtrC family response regulator